MKVLLNQNGNIREYDLTMFGKSVITFGRNSECDIVIGEEYISRVHGCFYYNNGEWGIQDMESSCGLYLNNQKVFKNVLHNGDIINIFVHGRTDVLIQFTVYLPEQHIAYNNAPQATYGSVYMDEPRTQLVPDNIINNSMGNAYANNVIQGYAPVSGDDKNWQLKPGPNSAQAKKKKKVFSVIIWLLILILIGAAIAAVIILKPFGLGEKSDNKGNGSTEEVTESTKNSSDTDATEEEEVIVVPDVEYKTYVQTDEWHEPSTNGEVSGTTGESKRVEAISINLVNQQYEGDIEYMTFVQGSGWKGGTHDDQSWYKNGETSGTTGKSKRIEAVAIRLTGELSEKCDVYYRVHCQSYGWMAWAKNGEPAGTAYRQKAVESIQIILVEKDSEPPADDFKGVVTQHGERYDEREVTVEEKAFYQYLSTIESTATGKNDKNLYHTDDQGNRNYFVSYVIADFDSDEKKELMIYSEYRMLLPDGSEAPFSGMYAFYEFDKDEESVKESNSYAQIDMPKTFTCYNNGTIKIGSDNFYIFGMKDDYMYQLGIMSDEHDSSGQYKSCKYGITYKSDGTTCRIYNCEGTEPALIREVSHDEGNALFSFIDVSNEIAVTSYDFNKTNIDMIIGN